MHNVKIKANPAASCEYHRVFLPFEHIDVTAKNPVFYFNRLPGQFLDVTKSLRTLGFKIICDFDDYWILEEDHYLYEPYKQLGILERSIAAIKSADVVTTTTAELASKLQEYNKNVVVIPNALPFDQGQFSRSKDKESGTPFIYVGGGSHRKDLSLITSHHDKLTIAGYTASEEWDKIVSSFEQSKIEQAKHSFSYMDFYDGHRITIAPLLKTTFNSYKSNLKVLEAGCKGLPIIASKCLPYFNGLDKDVVLFAANKSEWCFLMDKLLKNPSYAADVGERLAEHVRQHYRLDKANLIRKQIIESL